MTVTFATETPASSFEVTCSCGNAKGGEFATHDLAYASLLAGNKPVCGDDYCGAYFASVCPISDAPELNMSNHNARAVLELLGIETETLVGSMTGDDLLGRVLVAQAINPSDAGVPAVRDGKMIDCGRAEGYTDARLLELSEIASYAREHEVCVYWG